MQELVKKEIKLSDFPPKLRKLADYLIENVEYGTIKDACEKLSLNTDAVYVSIHKCRKRGIDLMSYVSGHWKEGLSKAKPLVRNALIKEAITGTAANQKLFFQLTGDLVERQEIKHELGLSFVFVNDTIPEDILQERAKEKANTPVIDVEPTPKGNV